MSVAGVPKGKQKPFRGVPPNSQQAARYYRAGYTPPTGEIEYFMPMQYGSEAEEQQFYQPPVRKPATVQYQPRNQTNQTSDTSWVRILPDGTPPSDPARRAVYEAEQKDIIQYNTMQEYMNQAKKPSKSGRYQGYQLIRLSPEKAAIVGSEYQITPRTFFTSEAAYEKTKEVRDYYGGQVREYNKKPVQPQSFSPEWSFEELGRQSVQGAYFGGGIGMIVTAPSGGVGAIPGAVAGFGGGAVGYATGYLSEFVVPENSPLPRLDIEKYPYVPVFGSYATIRKLTGKKEKFMPVDLFGTTIELEPTITTTTSKTSTNKIGNTWYTSTVNETSTQETGISNRALWEMAGFMGSSGIIGKGITKAFGSSLNKPVMPRAAEVKVGDKVMWRGISWETEGKATPLFGRTSGVDYKMGSPKNLKIESSSFEGGFVPKSATEAKIVRANVNYPEVQVSKIDSGLIVMRETKDVSSKFLRDSFSKEVKSLSPSQTKTVLGFAKNEKGYVFGSFAQETQMPKPNMAERMGVGLRQPADIDLRLPVSSERLPFKARELAGKLQGKGSKVRITGNTLIETQDAFSGEWHHAVDLKPNDLYGSVGKAETPYGFSINRKPIKVGGISTQRLSEQGLRKGANSIFTMNPEGVGPAAHRIKDIGDFINVQKVLLASKGGGSKAAQKALGNVEKAFIQTGEYVPNRNPVKLELYSPSSSSSSAFKAYFKPSVYGLTSSSSSPKTSSYASSKASSGISAVSSSYTMPSGYPSYLRGGSASRVKGSKSPGSSISRGGSDFTSKYTDKSTSDGYKLKSSASTYSRSSSSSSSSSTDSKMSYAYSTSTDMYGWKEKIGKGIGFMPGGGDFGSFDRMLGYRTKRGKRIKEAGDEEWFNALAGFTGGKRRKGKSKTIKGLLGFERRLR